MRKALFLLCFLLSACLAWLSCGNGSAAPPSHTSGIAYRAFLTNNVSSGTSSAGVYIVNAATDIRPSVSPISAGNNPNMMLVTPNRAQTLVFSGNGLPSSDNQFTIIGNSAEAASGHVNLPGMTYSFVVSPDSSTAYIAVPTGPGEPGQSPGLLEAVQLSSASVVGTVNVPALRYLSIDNSGDRILGFSDGASSVADSVAVITPSNIGIGNAVTFIGGPGIFDHPVAAFFTADDSTAYVLNCGPECGGTQASVQAIDMTTNPPTPGAAAPVPAATVALVTNSSMLYLAGTPYSGGAPSQPCTGQTTAATTCGLLTIFNLNSMTVVNTSPIVITDGYHDHIVFGANGQLFIGAHACTEILPPPPPATGETRGCLSIYNTLTTAVGSAPAGGVLIPSANGDVTGIQPITTRGASMAQEVVYVIQGQGVPQGGSLSIYDVTKDALEYNPNNYLNPGQIRGLVGNFYDVKTVDF
ncbi:MAG: hypothetical protein WAK29_01970 [Terriglobales bacterium]